jgi:flagellar M-ring protein FliF
MGEQLNKVIAPIIQFWKNLSRKVKILVIAGIVLIGIIALAVSILLNEEEYITIYKDVPQNEMTEIWAQLNNMNIKFKSDNDGRLMVPTKDEAIVRIRLAEAGYPKNGLSYYLIDQNNSPLSTDYQRKLTEKMQLQERLAATIQKLDSIQEAVVTVSMPSDNVYYLQQQIPASASVVVVMKQGVSLRTEEINTIKTLVSTSVNGLDPDNVSVTDNFGHDFTVSDTEGEAPWYELQRKKELELYQKLVNVLSGIYLPEEFRVGVTVVMNQDNELIEETYYAPSEEGRNSGVISREITSSDSSSSTSTDGGIPGTETNSQVPTYPVGGETGSSSSSSSGSDTTYVVSEKKTQILRNTPQILYTTVGVAIDRERFSPGERENIIALVNGTVNASPGSINVVNFKFYKDQPPTPAPEILPGVQGINLFILLGAIAAGLVLLALLLLFLLLRRRKKRKAKEAALAAEQEALIEAKLAEEELVEYDEEGFPIVPHDGESFGPIAPMRDKRREEIQDFAKQNPEITAQMIKSLLKVEES